MSHFKIQASKKPQKYLHTCGLLKTEFQTESTEFLNGLLECRILQTENYGAA